MTYFTPGERQRLADIILNAVGGDYQSARMPLRADLPVRFKALMSGANATDVLALNTDLTRLNETERLDDGRVPLQLYLGTFLSIFGSAAS
ncbi:MAG TPA: hypothetical protein VIT38_12765, partial [Allosphingosinicella sp.]